MKDMKIIMEKYFELLEKQDYDTGLGKEIDGFYTIEHFNEIIDSVVSEMSQEAIVNSLKQAFKRDMSKGMCLGESDEIWDELYEWAEE